MPGEDSTAIRVLLVSCHMQTIETLCQLIQKMAVHVETCATHAAANRKLNRSKFEGLIIDLEAEKEGLELLNRVRTSTSHKGMVSYAILRNPDQKGSAFRAGANFVFDRPLSSDLVGRTLTASYPLLVRERRRYFRCPIRAATSVKCDTSSEFTATSINVSESGMAILSPKPLRVGERVQLRLQLTGRTEPLAITGDICWADATGRTGIHFVNLGSKVSEQLQVWLSEHFYATPCNAD